MLNPARQAAFKAGYDAVDPGQSAKKRRRSVSIETKGEDSQLDQLRRRTGVALARDLERNYSVPRGHLRQFKVSAVGVGPKLSINLPDNAGDEAASWFNSIWAKTCESRQDIPLAEVCANVLTAKKREGDILCVFDDFIEDDGRLLFYEADQLVVVNGPDWERFAPAFCRENGKPMRQEQGIVYNKLGRTVAYIVTSELGKTSCAFSEVTVFPRGVARLLLEPWRMNQRRGVADLLTPAAHYLDGYEMLSSELQTAKLASKMAGKVFKKDGAEEAMLENGVDAEALVSQTTSSGAEPTVTGAAPQNYEAFEALTGGHLEYLQEGDDVEMFKIDRPNVNLQAFLDNLNGGNGASLGLAAVYASLKAAASYTAFRGEMLLTWAQFLWDQKWTERRFLDWITPKAIGWAIEHGQLSALPVGWEQRCSYTWPTMPEVDRARESTADTSDLRNGTTDFSRLLGPDWRKRFDALAEQLDYAREKGIPLQVLSTVAGAPMDGGAAPAAGKPDEDADDETKTDAEARHPGIFARIRNIFGRSK